MKNWTGALVVLGLFSSCGDRPLSLADTPPVKNEQAARAMPARVADRFAEYKRLMEDRLKAGVDVSAAERLAWQALEAMNRGDEAACLDLLDQATALLGAPRESLPERTGTEPPPAREGGNRPAATAAALPGCTAEDSPFGLHPAGVPGMDAPYAYANDIGVRFNRLSSPFIWGEVQRDLRRNVHVWDAPLKGAGSYDDIVGALPVEMCHLANTYVAPYARQDGFTPVDVDQYTAFVRAVVERYGGSGRQSWPGLRAPIRYWQVENEPLPDATGYVGLLEITTTAIKAADSGATVLAGGVIVAPDAQGRYVNDLSARYKQNIVDRLTSRMLDVFDIHFYGDARGNYRKFEDVYDFYRTALDRRGLDHVPIWVTEMGTYSGEPIGNAETRKVLSVVPGRSTYQSEELQAADVLRRYIFPLSLGVKKVFLAFGLKEGYSRDGSYFDMTGLVFDGRFAHDRGDNVKKLAYFTYQMMTEKLADAAWDQMEQVAVAPDNVFVYRIRRTDSDGYLYVVWWDWFNEPRHVEGDTVTVELPWTGESARMTRAVTDTQGQRSVEQVTARSGRIHLTLGESPVFVEQPE